MKLNMVFGPQDLANIRFAAFSPLQHLLIGVAENIPAPVAPAAARWWRSARRHAPHAAAPLLELINAHPWYIPDFFTPPVPASRCPGNSTICEELDALRAVSEDQITDELGKFDFLANPPRSVLALRDGGTRELARLVDVFRLLFRACLAGDWPDMRHRLETDVARRSAHLAAMGLGSMLRALHPRWATDPGWEQANTLSVNIPTGSVPVPDEMTFDLGGKGLLLAPNLFLAGQVAPVLTPWQQGILVYPAHTRTPPSTAGTRNSDRLGDLIGNARARALRAIGLGCTTADLAARLQVSAPTASGHASALRNARLISTVRDGRRVIHTLTPLGTDLLEGV